MPVLAPSAATQPTVEIEVTPEMTWAALEEWAGFDDGRDELAPFVARLYRAMEAARREGAVRGLRRRGSPSPR